MSVSKIKTLSPNGGYTSKNGYLYKHVIEFEDGQILNVASKTQTPPYKVGDVMVYEIKGNNDYGDYGSVKKQDGVDTANNAPKPRNQFKADPDKQASIERQVALKEAISFHATVGFITENKHQEVLETADIFFVKFLKSENNG